MLVIAPWPKAVIDAIEMWPCYNIISDLGGTGATASAITHNMFCMACHQRGVGMRMLLYGNPYDPTTVEQVQPDARIVYEKV